MQKEIYELAGKRMRLQNLRSPRVWGGGWGVAAGDEEEEHCPGNHKPGVSVLFSKVRYLVLLTLSSLSSLSLETSFHLLRSYFALR